MRKSPLNEERDENIRRLSVIWRAWFKQPHSKKQRARWHISVIAMAWGLSKQDNDAARMRAQRFLQEVDEEEAKRKRRFKL